MIFKAISQLFPNCVQNEMGNNGMEWKGYAKLLKKAKQNEKLNEQNKPRKQGRELEREREKFGGA